MVIIRELKDILSIKIKARHDSFCDQFNRMVMTKVLLIMSVIVGFNYFYDEVSCLLWKTNRVPMSFAGSSCWISGFYIYEEMKTRLDESIYYGIPSEIKFDGINRNGDLCSTEDKKTDYYVHPDHRCKPMTKSYYLQYQWLPFYIGSLSIFYYAPYIVFKMVNKDLLNLRKEIKLNANQNADTIIDKYFNHQVTSVLQLRLRVCWSLFVKGLYVFTCTFAFYLTDHLLLNKYVFYGKDYLKWSVTNMTRLHIAVKYREPKAGNVLLPSMGFCDLHEALIDGKETLHNKYRLICEISPNILYQYILMILWFFFIVSIAVSIIGMSVYIFSLLAKSHLLVAPKHSLFRGLTLREMEYLAFIKSHNMVVYGNVMRKLPLRAELMTFNEGLKLGDDYKVELNRKQTVMIDDDISEHYQAPLLRIK